MRLKQLCDNGNVVIQQREIDSHLNVDNRIWLLSNTANNGDGGTDNLQFNSDYQIESYNRTASNSISKATDEETIVCNRQYQINSENRGLCKQLYPEIKITSNLEGLTQLSRNIILEPTDASFSPSPSEEERAFEQSDSDEMSETGSHPIDPVPRGIVNPNYPGFQHLAHTLQHYSTSIEDFYHSENDMTDDDVDITDITDHSYDLKTEQNAFLESENLNNNCLRQDILSQGNDTISQPLDIPDILKTISQNKNNIITSEYETNNNGNHETNVENNYDTKDIIGNFNKEIEDEIRQLLNYNINIQSDLEELKKDIKDNLAKPIENTINNISDVVNHVIKKLIETQSDAYDQNDINNIYDSETVKQNFEECIDNISHENKIDTRTEMNEMNLTRPSFLLIDHNKDLIPDAFLSDGTEEINFEDDIYNPKTLRDNTERTIQKLGAKLRNIIPKLDKNTDTESHTLDKTDKAPVVTDGNSNEIDFKVSSDKPSRCCIRPSVLQLTGKKKAHSDKEQVVTNVSASSKNKPRVQNLAPPREGNSTKIGFRGSDKTSVHVTQNLQDIDLGGFDVYNIETALPKLDFDAIESHLKAAKEAERRKHNDREEIRRRLATGVDAEEYHSLGHGDRPARKPSLQSRLQSGKHLQICYMNEIASDNESQTAEDKSLNASKSLSRLSISSKSSSNHPYQTRPLSVNITKQEKLNIGQSAMKLRPPLISRSKSRSTQSLIEIKESDFYALQATLQTEARIALAQAKEMARVEMERERRALAESPVTVMLRRSMEKANAPLAPDRRRVSRQLLTDLNVAQLQVIVNELHGQIAALNESLVRLLMSRDELHMGQDSVLVDIEDLTRYLDVKEQSKKTKGSKSGVKRLTSFVHK